MHSRHTNHLEFQNMVSNRLFGRVYQIVPFSVHIATAANLTNIGSRGCRQTLLQRFTQSQRCSKQVML